MNTINHNKGRKFPPQPLTKDEVLALMDVCSRRAPTGIRDRALICLLWRGQLRISEALDLKPADLDAESCTIRILHGKGDKSRVAVIDRQTVEVLNHWLAVRGNLGINGHAPIFCTLKGGPMSTAHVRSSMLPRRGRKAGITKRVHAHGLRHSGASDLAGEGVPLIEIMAQLGHQRISTTSTYIHNINPTARIERLRERTW